jgi:hypothetical protein
MQMAGGSGKVSLLLNCGNNDRFSIDFNSECEVHSACFFSQNSSCWRRKKYGHFERENTLNILYNESYRICDCMSISCVLIISQVYYSMYSPNF